jgi:hypothetical protein
MDLSHAQPRTALIRGMAVSLLATLLAACGAGTKNGRSSHLRRLLDADGIGSVRGKG